MEAWLKKLGLGAVNPGVFDGRWHGGAAVASVSPIDGQVIARVREATPGDYNPAVGRAHEAFLKWRVTPGALPTPKFGSNSKRGVTQAGIGKAAASGKFAKIVVA